jgi:hypothetical protein
MAIDPMHIALDAVPEFLRAGGIGALATTRAGAVRCSRIHARSYAGATDQDEALRLAFDHFFRDEWES